MSELTNISENRANFRRLLLATVSAIALTGSMSAACAGDSDPPVWIELGGQLEQMNDGEQPFAPPFILAAPRPSVQTISPLSVEQPLRFSNGAKARISFEPDGSSWVFSASARFGRANGNKHVHQQTYPQVRYVTYNSHVIYVVKPKAALFVDANARRDESHTVLDFQAGKDVGLGMFGGKGSSTFNLGVRFAQFSSKSSVILGSDPDFHIVYSSNPIFRIPMSEPYHSNAATLTATRSFHGVGPSISWNASVPIVGNAQAGEVALDWGLNAAVLFGRQKVVEHHQTTGWYKTPRMYGYPRYVVYQTGTGHTRSHVVTVPNVGGFVGVSLRYANARVSFGYRADLFFGAMDGGIDAAKKENIGFYGPFATISIGIGG